MTATVTGEGIRSRESEVVSIQIRQLRPLQPQSYRSRCAAAGRHRSQNKPRESTKEKGATVHGKSKLCGQGFLEHGDRLALPGLNEFQCLRRLCLCAGWVLRD